MTKWKTPPSQEELDAAKARFAAWILWYLRTYPEKAPSQAALARLMGVNKAAITILLTRAREGRPRSPAFETAIGLAAVTGHPVDYLFSEDPPAMRKG